MQQKNIRNNKYNVKKVKKKKYITKDDGYNLNQERGCL